ncbi:alpha/beta fold hydrolase [Peptococcus simiae]|uniref:Alpha/beta fold hydrolase n=1 Tax=Peptococcus simiae TaxID=1643805 RepID=A0ABW9H1X2_9FIRM
MGFDGVVKPRLLLIHGWLHSRKRYLPLARALADRYDVVLQPLPGYDDIGRPTRTGGHLAWYADQVAGRIRRQRPQVVVGFSMGGQILLRALQDRTLTLPWAVFSNTPYPALAPINGLVRRGWPVAWGLRAVQKAPRPLGKGLVDLFARQTVRDHRLVDDLFYEDACRVKPAVAAASAQELARGIDRVAPLKHTAAVVTGSGHDRLVPLAQARHLARDLAVPLVTFPEAGHTVVLDALADYVSFLGLLARRL